MRREATTAVLKASIHLKEWAFFDKVVKIASCGFEAKTLFTWVVDAINNENNESDENSSSNALTFSEVEGPLLRAVTTASFLSDALAALEITSISPLWQDWTRKALEGVLGSLSSKKVSYQDGKTLIGYCLSYGVDYVDNALSALKRSSSHTAFFLGVVNHMGHAIQTMEDTERKQKWLLIYESLAACLVGVMDVPSLSSHFTLEGMIERKEKEHSPFLERARIPRAPGLPPAWEAERFIDLLIEAVRPDWLVEFCDGLAKFNTLRTIDAISSLSLRIKCNINKLRPGPKEETEPWRRCSITHIWFPLLLKLVPILKGIVVTSPQSSPSSLSLYQTLYVAVFNAHMKYSVGPCPGKRAPTLVRPTVKCDCLTCDDFNEFLESPQRFLFSQGLSKERRDHLTRLIKKHNIQCSIQTLEDNNPKVLVVTKTVDQKKVPFEEWNARKESVQQKILALPQDDIKLLLGQEYHSVVSMAKLYPNGQVPPIPPARAIHSMRRSIGSNDSDTSSRALTPRSANATATAVTTTMPASTSVPVVPRVLVDRIAERQRARRETERGIGGCYLGDLDPYSEVHAGSRKRRPVMQSVDLDELDAYYQTM